MAMHDSTHTRSRVRVVSTLALVAAGALLISSPVAAIPPDGSGADTPGTSSWVSPTTLTPCATLSYGVTGFPAGETLYIKIDDGIGYGDTSVQGAGVYATQALNSSGSASGSFELPCDITPGSHWLRMLASEYVDASDPGKGIRGFTRRGGNDFTVVAAQTGGGAAPDTSTGGSTGGSTPGTAPGTGSSGSVAPGTTNPGTTTPGSTNPGSTPQGSTPQGGADGVVGTADDAAQNVTETGVVTVEGGIAAPAVPLAPAARAADLPADGDGGVVARVDAGDYVLSLPGIGNQTWVYVYAYSEPTGLGWRQVGPDGTIRVSIEEAGGSDHHLAIVDAAGELLGWTALSDAADAEGVTPESTATPTAAAEPAAEAAASDVPIAGIAGAGVLVLGGVIAAAVMLRRSRPAAPAPGAPETGASADTSVQ